MGTALFVQVCLFGAVGCEFKKGAAHKSAPRFIIGGNDLTRVIGDGTNIPEKYKKLLDAFGLITTTSSCTGSHIGEGIVLTAGHCFGAGPVLQTDIPCSEHQIAWGVRLGKEPYLRSQCTKILAMQKDKDSGLDFAIAHFTLSPSVKIEVEMSAPRVGMSLTIFGHPHGSSLVWSKVCPLLGFHQYRKNMTYPCDTDVGHSGSAVLNDEDLKVIGIHSGGTSQGGGQMVNYGTALIDTPLSQILKGK